MLTWGLKLCRVLLRSVRLVVHCIIMRMWFLVDPGARERDLQAVTAAYNFPEEGLKHIQWRNAHTVSKFFYTFKMIHSYFVDQLQDINKTAVLYHPAPNPQLHDPKTGVQVSLLSVSPSGTAEEPLVINFGSCT